jgi:hypothetical protein
LRLENRLAGYSVRCLGATAGNEGSDEGGQQKMSIVHGKRPRHCRNVRPRTFGRMLTRLISFQLI